MSGDPMPAGRELERKLREALHEANRVRGALTDAIDQLRCDAETEAGQDALGDLVERAKRWAFKVNGSLSLINVDRDESPAAALHTEDA